MTLSGVSASAETAIRLLQVVGDIDVVDMLPQVAVPTLVLHSRGDARVPFERGLMLRTPFPTLDLSHLKARTISSFLTSPLGSVIWTTLCGFLYEADESAGQDADRPIRQGLWLTRYISVRTPDHLTD